MKRNRNKFRLTKQDYLQIKEFGKLDLSYKKVADVLGWGNSTVFMVLKSKSYEDYRGRYAKKKEKINKDPPKKTLYRDGVAYKVIYSFVETREVANVLMKDKYYVVFNKQNRFVGIVPDTMIKEKLTRFDKKYFLEVGADYSYFFCEADDSIEYEHLRELADIRQSIAYLPYEDKEAIKRFILKELE